MAVLGFVAGVGVTALGPGGVLVTIGLFAFTNLSPAQIAGTAMVTNITTGVLAAAAYTRSGQLRDRSTRRTALILAATAVIGAPLGVVINKGVSSQAFGILLGAFVAAVAALVWYRDRHSPVDTSHRHPSPITVVALGFGVATASGLVGVGGPVLAVPLLIALDVPVLSAIAAAQVQSVAIAGIGTLGYFAVGVIDWRLAAVIAIPELAGALLGWIVARALPIRTLKYTLVVSLLGLAPYLIFHG
ncbi:sulfite exporter TauE/SafE family protein [Nocardia sp. NEAU-G5]|uniref:Probable membrane transporter protein n=2 Tax=Nocardia albiluteola TaxID=2842303 RepID=A0ABS6BBU4_9NOCA|nr:sulfite exporter TauE/SafE family protein [Nocardia albiluteola]